MLRIVRDVAEKIVIDGTRLPLATAARGLLPDVYYERGPKAWQVMSDDASQEFAKNEGRRKRHNLQGPIDDAFMEPFVCVLGTGKPYSASHEAWAQWTLKRFAAEFDKWMRGRVEIVKDTELTKEHVDRKNIILVCDPGSNSLLAKVLPDLPIKWGREAIEVNGTKYDPETHGLSLIYPNPLNPQRYVVINSGHTFHEQDFKASNSWLFPRLGDVAVQKFARGQYGGYTETVIWADFFNASWKLSKVK